MLKTGYIHLQRAYQSENNHGHHIEVSFQTELLKIGHFEGCNWWTLRSHDSLPRFNCVTMALPQLSQQEDTEVPSKAQFVGSLHP